MSRRLVLLVAACAALTLAQAPARAAPLADSRNQDKALCMRHIVEAERRMGIPARLLSSVALAESGRRDPDGSAIVAWPWTVMAEGNGRYFATKAAAVTEIAKLRARGVRNIDVGCMQINLMYHPDAFPDLETALDPASNVAYGAELLGSLRNSAGSWTQAVAQYHTQDQDRGRDYMARVLRIWGSPAGREAASAVAAAEADARPRPLAGASAASLVARAAAADGKPSASLRLDQRPQARPWTEVVRGRAKFAEWLARRQDERRPGAGPEAKPERDPS